MQELFYKNNKKELLYFIIIHDTVLTMKSKSTKTKTKQLIRKYGRKPLAKLLGIHLSYIYKLENGFVPGWRLYRDIINLDIEDLNDN